MRSDRPSSCRSPAIIRVALQVDPILLTFDNSRAAMKAKYLGELFPATWPAAPGVAFAEFFRKDRDGVAKGLVRLGLKDLP